MEPRIRFVADDALLTAMRAAGISALSATQWAACPLSVGDVIALGSPAPLAFRVSSRFFSPAHEGRPATWYVTIEPTPHPMDDPQWGRRSEAQRE
jgi:hypothetical protein